MGRAEEAQEIIKSAQRWSFAVGLCPLPWVDVAAITYIQVEMIERLCSLYAVPYRETRAKALRTAVVGALLPTAVGANVARAAARHVPGIGPMIAALSLPTSLAGSTTIIGKLAAEHFAAGGDLADFGLKVRPETKPAASAPTPPPPAPPERAQPKSASEALDDLTAITGVGPKIAELLRDAEITTFAQLAALSEGELRELLSAAGPRFRSHDPSSWPTQAAARRGAGSP